MATQCLLSPGYMCQLLQRSPSQIGRWLEELKAEPVLMLNETPYYSDTTHGDMILLMCRRRRVTTTAIVSLDELDEEGSGDA